MDYNPGASTNDASQNQGSISNELRFVLEKLLVLHGGLVEVLRLEYAQVAGVDLKGLAESAHAKEVMLGEIWNLEQLRMTAAEKLATTLGLNSQAASLLDIAAMLPQNEGDQLRSARIALNLLVQQAKDLNASNMNFVESSLCRIEEMKRNALGISSEASKENYSNSGSRQPLGEQGGRLLSTEA